MFSQELYVLSHSKALVKTTYLDVTFLLSNYYTLRYIKVGVKEANLDYKYI